MRIIAHKGLSGFYPENIMLAFKKCLNLNIYGIELDVQKTKDNQIVVIHDEKVDRTFNGTGYIKDMTLSELQSLNSNFKNYENNKDCKIPTLKEVLTLFKPTDFIINIELKNNKIKYKNLEEDVINLVKELKMERRVIISSFRMKSLNKVKDLCPKITRSYLISERLYKYRLKNMIFCKAIKNNSTYLSPNYIIADKKFINKCHRRDIKILCYTVNTIEEYEKLLKLKVDGIFTDFPNIFPAIKK